MYVDTIGSRVRMYVGTIGSRLQCMYADTIAGRLLYIYVCRYYRE